MKRKPGRPRAEAHPALLNAKVLLRRHVLEAVKPSHILDLFCGERILFRAVWQYAQDYVACDDMAWTIAEEARYVCDNRRLLRCLDLHEFNVFDLDAFGSPWEQMAILAVRRPWDPGERGAIVITDGSTLKTRFGELPGAMQHLCGFTGRRIPATTAGAEDLRRLALAGFARRAGVRPLKQWEAVGPRPVELYYAAVIFTGLPSGKGQKRDAGEPA